MGKKSKKCNDFFNDKEINFLINHQLFKEEFHIVFENADLENNIKLFEEIYKNPDTFNFCKLHSENTTFKWKNWKAFLKSKE